MKHVSTCAHIVYVSLTGIVMDKYKKKFAIHRSGIQYIGACDVACIFLATHRYRQNNKMEIFSNINTNCATTCSMMFAFMTSCLVDVKKSKCANVTASYFIMLFNITLLNSFMNFIKKRDDINSAKRMCSMLHAFNPTKSLFLVVGCMWKVVDYFYFVYTNIL